MCISEVYIWIKPKLPKDVSKNFAKTIFSLRGIIVSDQ